MTQEQFDKLDKCHFNFSINDNCIEERIKAVELLGVNRFDLYAILIYIDAKVRSFVDMDYAVNIYKERTRAITGFTFSEDGNDNKNNFKDYLYTLDSLIEEYRTNKIKDSKFLIPVDKDRKLIDGAHRVACAAYFGKEVSILQFIERKVIPTDYKTMIGNIMPSYIADAMALESVKWHQNLYMLFLWPKASAQKDNLNEALDLIHSDTLVMYEKKQVMSYMAIRNLMIQIYGHMDWVGTIDNDFQSTYAKADDVWENNGICYFILVQSPSCQHILNLKSKIRNIFNIGLASIHSTDNIRETTIAANAIYNPNSLHFLERGRPTTYKKSYKLTENFKEGIITAKANTEQFIVDSSMILAMYGIREAEDLDYYKDSEKVPESINFCSSVEEHDIEQLSYYDIPLTDLMYNPHHYFSFNEIKYICLRDLQHFKTRRYNIKRDEKDKADLKIISLLLSEKERKWSLRKERIRAIIRRQKRILIRRYHVFRNYVLRKMGLYTFAKNIKKKIRK